MLALTLLQLAVGAVNITLLAPVWMQLTHLFMADAVWIAVLLLVLFYVGYRLIGWVLARWGGAWGIRGLDDWASLPALMFLLSVFSFITSPIGSAFSRHQEHQADQYGLEVTHGLTPDSGQVAAQAFQILGEVDLADPDPNPRELGRSQGRDDRLQPSVPSGGTSRPDADLPDG